MTKKSEKGTQVEDILGSLDEEDLELINFISAVVKDGRYITELDDPSKSAEKLGYKLSSKASAKINDMGIPAIAKMIGGGGGGDVSMLPIAVVVVIVIVFGPRRPTEQAISDDSGKDKL